MMTAMETLKHDLPHLFRQLGLPSDPASMDAFIASHRLPAGVALQQAAFWSEMQSQFLCEAIVEDSHWSIAVDELSARLS
jgi:Protein of unknown function (DUF2789)